MHWLEPLRARHPAQIALGAQGSRPACSVISYLRLKSLSLRRATVALFWPASTRASRLGQALAPHQGSFSRASAGVPATQGASGYRRYCHQDFNSNLTLSYSAGSSAGQPAWTTPALACTKMALVAVAAVCTCTPHRLTELLPRLAALPGLHKIMQAAGVLLLVPAMMSQALEVKLEGAVGCCFAEAGLCSLPLTCHVSSHPFQPACCRLL